MQKFATINGKKIAYSDVGEGQPIVCVHGWAMHKGLFSNLEDSLSGKFRVISIDLAGHGSSRNTEGPYTIERSATDVFLLCEMLDLEDIIAVGWSMGMHVWWEMIEQYGEEFLSGLVSIDMSPKVYNAQDWQHGTLSGRTVDGIEDMLTDMCKDWTTFTYRFVPRIFARGLGDKWASLAEKLMRDTLKNDPNIMANYWRSMTSKDYRLLLETINTPTLITRGERSQLYGLGAAEFMQKTLPQSQIIKFAQSGHAPHLEQPELFTETLAQFVRENQPSIQSPMKKGNHHA